MEKGEPVNLESMVILVQQGDEGALTVPVLGSGQEHQVFTLVSQGYEGTTEDELPVLPSSEEQVGDLLAPTDDGQVLYLTYTVNPCQEQQRMILHVGEDGSTYVLPAEEAAVVAETPDSKKSKRRRTEQVVESQLHLEDRLEVLDAMLAPAPDRPKRRRARGRSEEPAEEKREYVCDLCGACFARAAQYYGHLHSHSGERKWECGLCTQPTEFPSQSLLRRHEKQCHLNLRPHVCGLCQARFDRASQLSYHERRIHAGERPHTCQICHKGFFKRSDLRTHLNIHLGINKSICEVCGKKFNHVSNLIRHTRMHSGIKPYPCTVCGRRFSQLNAMHQHKVSHQSEKEVGCGLCSKMFKSVAVMRKHMRHMHGDKEASAVGGRSKEGGQSRRFYCKVCGESFEFAALLKEHERKHEKEGSFHCQCCAQDFSSLELLKTHSCQTAEERLQKEAEAAAEAQRLSFSALNSQLESLLQEDAGLVDDGGLVIYVTQEGQETPAQVYIKPLQAVPTKELQTPPPPPVAPVETAAPADQDPMPDEMLLFESSPLVTVPSEVAPVYLPPATQAPAPAPEPVPPPAPAMVDVVDTVEPTDPLEPSEEESPRDPLLPDAELKKRRVARVYKCSECGKVFMKNSNYKQHLGTHFIDQMNYCCSVCGQFFAWKSTLNKHILRSHTTAKPPVCHCEICHREYASAGLVQDHIKRDHYKQRPHSCAVCKKTFYKKYDLTIHFRTHTKERPYICRTCGKTFYHLSHVIRHERIHSGYRPYRCGDCGRLFNQSSSLKSHRKRHAQQGTDKNTSDDLSLVQTVEFPLDDGNMLLYSAALASPT